MLPQLVKFQQISISKLENTKLEKKIIHVYPPEV